MASEFAGRVEIRAVCDTISVRYERKRLEIWHGGTEEEEEHVSSSRRLDGLASLGVLEELLRAETPLVSVTKSLCLARCPEPRVFFSCPIPLLFRSVRELSIRHSALWKSPSLCDFLREMPLIEVLELNSCGLEEVPGQIQALKLLRSLDLCNNEIRIVPDWVLELPRLASLFFEGQRNCEVEYVPLQVASPDFRYEGPLGGCDQEEEYSLFSATACGLASNCRHWTSFLTRGLYDPRLFLLVQAWRRPRKRKLG